MTTQPDEQPTEWTQEQVEALHEMSIDYIHSRWFWKKARWWLAWWVGLPAVIVSIWEPLAHLWRLVKGLFGAGR